MSQDDFFLREKGYEEPPESRDHRLRPKTRKEREAQESKKEIEYGNNGTLRTVKVIMQETANNRFNHLRNKLNNKK